ncbi:MAG: gamma-butyrobetaine hydroxylase-like domain-containing protein [Rhizomicrobium sp.]
MSAPDHASEAEAWPSELRVNPARDRLSVRFDDGMEIQLAAERLRVESPSAEVRGHGGARPPGPKGKQGVKIVKLEPVGNYAVRIIFDDGHDSGLYSWTYLKQLGSK